MEERENREGPQAEGMEQAKSGVGARGGSGHQRTLVQGAWREEWVLCICWGTVGRWPGERSKIQAQTLSLRSDLPLAMESPWVG